MRILIQGTPSEGKTTIAELILSVLREQCIKVTTLDDDADAPDPHPMVLMRRVSLLSGTITVEIKTETT